MRHLRRIKKLFQSKIMHLDEIDGEGDVKELEITPLPTPDEVN